MRDCLVRPKATPSTSRDRIGDPPPLPGSTWSDPREPRVHRDRGPDKSRQFASLRGMACAHRREGVCTPLPEFGVLEALLGPAVVACPSSRASHRRGVGPRSRAATTAGFSPPTGIGNPAGWVLPTESACTPAGPARHSLRRL